MRGLKSPELKSLSIVQKYVMAFLNLRLATPMLLAGLLAGLLFTGDAWAMRCKSKIISKDDIQAKVLKYCGEPVTRNQHYIERSDYYAWRNSNHEYIGSDGYRRYPASRFLIEILVEIWVYNFGPNKLMREVTFENGIVVKVETLERGFRE